MKCRVAIAEQAVDAIQRARKTGCASGLQFERVSPTIRSSPRAKGAGEKPTDQTGRVVRESDAGG